MFRMHKNYTTLQVNLRCIECMSYNSLQGKYKMSRMHKNYNSTGKSKMSRMHKNYNSVNLRCLECIRITVTTLLGKSKMSRMHKNYNSTR